MLLPPESTVDHETVIDAAVKAGVKHFFPSEYGVRTYHPAFAQGVLLATKKRSIVKHLEKTQDIMSWTGIMCNPWVDFVSPLRRVLSAKLIESFSVSLMDFWALT